MTHAPRPAPSLPSFAPFVRPTSSPGAGIVVGVILDDGTQVRDVPITSKALQDLFAYLTAEQARLQALDGVDTWGLEVHAGPAEMRVKPRPDFPKYRRRT